MTYRFAYEKVTPGELTRAGVLDLGLRCPHSCTFCYYSFLDGTSDRFRGMRHAPQRPLQELKRGLDQLAIEGIEQVDITGGEPLHHPDLVEIVRHAEQELDVRTRIITLGQLFQQTHQASGLPLLQALLEVAEVSDFLISLHAVDGDLYRKVTGGSFDRVQDALELLDERSFSYCTNTVVFADNAFHVPSIAHYLVDRKRHVRLANFITMNAFFEWREGRALGTQARYSDLSAPILEATRSLERSGIGVNIRYGPLCAFRGLEKNHVGTQGLLLDPYEWRNDLRLITKIYATDPNEAAAFGRERLRLEEKEKPAVCGTCSHRGICDGVDKQYLEAHGTSELVPYSGPEIHDLMHYRRSNPAAFAVKRKVTPSGETRLPHTARPRIRAGRKLGGIVRALRNLWIYRLTTRRHLTDHSVQVQSAQRVTWEEAKDEPGNRRRLSLPCTSTARVRILAPPASCLKGQITCDIPGTGSREVRFRIRSNAGRDRTRRYRISPRGGLRRTRVPLGEHAGQLVTIELSCHGEWSPGDHVTWVEPILIAGQPLREFARLALHNVRTYGFSGSFRRLMDIGHHGTRDTHLSMRKNTP